MATTITKETELYAPVKKMLESEGYTVRGEIRHCDLVAYRDGETEPTIVELKKTFNLPLVFQAIERLRLSPYVYAAVAYNPRKGVSGYSWNDCIRLCRKLGVGLIGVQFYKRKAPAVHVLCKPGDREGAARKSHVGARRLKREFESRSGDFNTGGSTGTKLVTAYREVALRCARELNRHETLSPRELRDMLHLPTVAPILQANYYGWFERVVRGRYRLSAEGHAALATFADVVKSI